jgi:protocatechuate 3,4-dioxygenase beta subunit
MEEKKKNLAGIAPIMTRRNFLTTGLIMTASIALAACGIKLNNKQAAVPSATASTATATASASTALEPTPACGSDHGATPEVTEGPYFTPNSPETNSLYENGMEGTVLTITGYILTADCKPVAKALLDVWQANSKGEYDNSGFILRGHQYTDDQGRYTVKTIVPGLYPGRTRHIHVKFQAPNEKIVTSQLFFPNEPGNAGDGIFLDTLLMKVSDNADGSKSAMFNFVV